MSGTVISSNRDVLPPRLRAAAATHAPSQPRDSLLATISRLPLLAGLSADRLAEFAARTRWQIYAAGETIVDIGEAKNDVFFIIEGEVRVVVRTAFGYESVLGDLGKGEFFGEVAAIDGIPRSASVTALVHTRLCAVVGPAFMDLVLSSPEVGHRLLRLLSSRLRNKDERLIEFSVLTVRQRLIAELLRLSRARSQGERVITPPPQQHILAARIGTRRESVSREMAGMSRSGLITIGRGGIVLHRPEVLKAEIEARLQGSADLEQSMEAGRS